MARPIVITGGGTGGHIFPMQAIAEKLMAQGVAASELRYVGSRRGQEATLLSGGAVSLTLLPGRGIRRSLAPPALAANVGAAIALVGAVVLAIVRVGLWRPRVVVSVGGYASFAVSFAAVLWRCPLVLVELDATPGAVQRLMSRFATRRCTAFASSEPRCVITGAPLREAITAIDRTAPARERARQDLAPPIEEGRMVVVVMTGSLGSTKVNRAVRDLAELWSARRDRTILHVTGRRDFLEISQAGPVTQGLDYRVIDFGDMATLWQLCDVAVCRSGATTVAELTALGIASILVPLPGAPGDHQTHNAMSIAAAGGARVIADAQLDARTLGSVLDEIMEPALLASMSSRAASLGRRDASAEIAANVLDVGGQA